MPDRTAYDEAMRLSQARLKVQDHDLKQVLPKVSTSTIRQVLHEAGYRFGKTRTWCPTGTALRVRKAGTVTVQDPKAGEKTS